MARDRSTSSKYSSNEVILGASDLALVRRKLKGRVLGLFFLFTKFFTGEIVLIDDIDSLLFSLFVFNKKVSSSVELMMSSFFESFRVVIDDVDPLLFSLFMFNKTLSLSVEFMMSSFSESLRADRCLSYLTFFLGLT